MKILLCGSSDLKMVSAIFEGTVLGLGATPVHFLNAMIQVDNHERWEKISENSVIVADIVVYVMIHNFGEITWHKEYVTAQANGKEFIILCYESIYSLFFGLKERREKIENQNENEKKIFEVMDNLLLDNVTIISFNFDTFRPILQQQILKIFERGVESLEINNRKKTLLQIVKDKNSNELKKKNLSFGELDLLKDMLKDSFEHKEVRKRIMDFFVDKQLLDLDTIIELCIDPEQGISRKAITVLPVVVKPQPENFVKTFEVLIDLAKETDDIGTIRRIIAATLEIHALQSIPFLYQLFPASEISIPKKILAFYNGFEGLEDHADYREYQTQFKELIDSCEFYEKGASLETLVKDVKLKYGFPVPKTKKKKGS